MKIEPNELTLLDAYELGIDDGLMNGSEVALHEGLIGEDTRSLWAYRRCYEHGVALYCEIKHPEGETA